MTKLRTTAIRTTEGSSVPTPQSTRPWLWVNTAENFDNCDFERWREQVTSREFFGSLTNLRGEGFRYLATRMLVIETRLTVSFSLISVVLYEYCKSVCRVTISRVPLIIGNSLLINFTRKFNWVALPYIYPIVKHGSKHISWSPKLYSLWTLGVF